MNAVLSTVIRLTLTASVLTLLGSSHVAVAKTPPTTTAQPEPCVGGYATGVGGVESSLDCRDGKKPAAIAQVGASVEQLEFVSAQEVLFAGCTDLPPLATASREAGNWLCPIRPLAGPAPVAPTSGPAAIARQAGLRLIARAGTVGISPPRTLVGLPTYFWLDGVGRRQAQHSQDGWRLRILAQPVGYTWDFGDGDQLTGGPGQAQPPQTSDIQHLYRRLGRYQVAVQVTWHVTFQVNGRTLDAPGEFTTTASTELPVDELRARLTH